MVTITLIPLISIFIGVLIKLDQVNLNEKLEMVALIIIKEEKNIGAISTSFRDSNPCERAI